MGVVRKFRGDPAGEDHFLGDFFRDMSPALARSFTDEQLREIKMQFGARKRGAHSVDLRFSVPLLRCYVVLLIGREGRSNRRRNRDRLKYPLATVGNLAVAAVLLILLAIPVAMVLTGLSAATVMDPMEAVQPGLTESIRQQLVLLIKGL